MSWVRELCSKHGYKANIIELYKDVIILAEDEYQLKFRKGSIDIGDFSGCLKIKYLV